MKFFVQIRCWFSLFLTLLSIVVRVSSLRYMTGDFLVNPDSKSRDGSSYPKFEVDNVVSKELNRFRRSRSLQFLDDPWATRKTLLEWHMRFRINHQRSFQGREIKSPSTSNTVLPPDIDANIKMQNEPSLNKSTTFTQQSCGATPEVPQRLCKTKFNTTAPMYGVSLTSGEPVTIVQKFPDLLQQVIFEVCASDTCDVVHGDCVQTYVPYLFLVIPLGPVTLTGQDYVLVESGCVCRPKYAGEKAPPNPLDAIGFETEQ